MAYQLIPGDKARRAIDPATGQIISRRQYDKLYKTFGLSYEEKAKSNRARNLELALSRPARGRKSIQKLPEQERKLIVEARKEALIRQRELEKELKAQNELQRLINKRQAKKVKKYAINTRLLKSGHYARRIPFEDWDDYIRILKEARLVKQIRFYGLGIEGYDENNGNVLTATVFTMRTMEMTVSEEDFYEEMETALMEWSYFHFTNYWIHLAFAKEYAQERKNKKDKRDRAKRAARR